MQEQDIRRLKKTVKDTQSALRENVAVIEESNHKGPLDGLTLVDSTVKFTNQVLEERRRLQDENEQLRKKIEALEEARKLDGFDREKFYEGAAWMGKQAVTECDEGLKRFETVKGDYKKRMNDSAKDQYLRERISEWVIDSCERITKETRDHTQAMLENAMRNKNANAKFITSTLYDITK